MEEKRKQALQLLYEFLKYTTTISAEDFMRKMKNIPLYYTQQLSKPDIYFKVFGRTQYYELESYIIDKYKNKITNIQEKISAYKAINNDIKDFLNNIKFPSNKKINNYIYQELIACINANDNFIEANNQWKNDDWIALTRKINVTGLYELVANAIKQDFNQRKDFYYKKVKGWINDFYESYLLKQNKNNYNPIVTSLQDLKNINKIGEEFDIAKEVIYEIDNSVKDKFVWIPDKFITSDDGYGLHHAQMYANLIEERRNNIIDKDRKDFISNARIPEDLNINVTEEEKQIPAIFGSYYFNKEIAIIEGKYLISRGDNNYNKVIEILKKKFKHIFDLSIENKNMKQESKLKNFKRLIPKKYFKQNNDIRTVLLTSPLYNSDQSYSQFINQNNNNEMFRHLKYNEPRQIVHNIKDFNKKYLENDNFTLKKI